MKHIKVKKNKLLKILKKNKEDHIKAYKEAIVAYHNNVIEHFKEVLEEVEGASPEGVEAHHYFNDPKPTNNSSSYDRAIGMLEMHIDDEIDLSADEYRNFVEDDWDWKGQFAGAYMSSTGKALR